jgi:AcrR family transcriptional regulator
MADGTRERILEATVRAMATHGLARLTLEDVAREAGMSRQTVHRYFGTKDALIEAAILHEEEALIEAVSEAAARHDDARAAIEAAVDTALSAAREHPLLDRLLTTEPETLLPFLTRGTGPVLAAPRVVIEELLTERVAGLDEERAAWAADALSRLLISYAVNPPAQVDEVPGRLARLVTEGLGDGR